MLNHKSLREGEHGISNGTLTGSGLASTSELQLVTFVRFSNDSLTEAASTQCTKDSVFRERSLIRSVLSALCSLMPVLHLWPEITSITTTCLRLS